MAEEKKIDQQNENIDVPGATQDPDIDVSALLRSAKPAAAPAAEAPATPADTGAAEAGKPLSPLEQMKAEEASGANPKGMVVKSEDLGNGRLKEMGERFDADMEAKIKESDALIEKRKHVVLLQATRTEEDLVQAMDELETLEQDAVTGEWKFTDDEPKKYFRIRTAEDGEYDLSNEAANVGVAPDKVINTDGTEVPIEKTQAEKDEEKKKEIVEIIIDKTQSGNKIDFTPEERMKMREASEIHLKQVKMVNIPSAFAKRDPSKPSFKEMIRKQTVGRDTYRMYFPASGFSADMRPLSYGEMNDIAFDPESVKTEQHVKRMSVIFNHMTNISIGSFDSFDDFLRQFAYTDIPLAVYGLYCATYPEVQQIQMTCGNCQANFNATFSTRGLYKLENCSLKYVESLKALIEASPSQYDEMHENSAVMTIQSLEMPNSGIIFNIGIASAYDYIYNFTPLMDTEKVKEIFPDDVNSTQIETSAMLLSVRSVSLANPEAEGGFDTFTDYKDILDAVYAIDPEEIRILASVLEQKLLVFNPNFALNDVVCSHCNHKTESVAIDIDSLVFLTTLTLKNTGIDVSNMLD